MYIRKFTVRTVLITLLLFGMICTVMFWFIFLADSRPIPEWIISVFDDNPTIVTLMIYYVESYLFLINIPISLVNVICAVKGYFRSKFKSKTSTVIRRYLVYAVISSAALVMHWVSLFIILSSRFIMI